jgi:hypothetical protein
MFSPITFSNPKNIQNFGDNSKEKTTQDPKKPSSIYFSDPKHKQMVIAGIALTALGIDLCFNYFMYNHLNSTSTKSLIQPNQIPVPLNPQFESFANFEWFWQEDDKSISNYYMNYYSVYHVAHYCEDGLEMPFYNVGVKISLYDLHKMTEQKQQVAVERFKLQDSINALGKENFFKKLADVDKHVLELANLVDLKYYSEKSGLKYILMNNEEFNQLTIGELKDISFDQKRKIFERLKNTNKEQILDSDLKTNIQQMSLIKFSSLSGKQISQYIDQIPLNIFSLFSKDQFIGLDLSNVSESQINNLFSGVLTREVDKNRFESLSTEQVNKILDKLDGYHIDLISDDQLKGLDLSKLTVDQFNKIIDELSSFRIYLISDDQLKRLDLSKLKENLIRKMFNEANSLNENKRRFALLPVDLVNKILDKLCTSQMNLISDDQLKGLDFSKLTKNHIEQMFDRTNGLSENKRRFALLPVDQINKILDILDNYQMSLISDDQLKGLYFSKLTENLIFTENLIRKIFDRTNSLSEDKRRFALLSKEQVNAIFDKLDDYQKTLISDSQWSKIKVKT